MTNEEAIEKFGKPLTLEQLRKMNGKPVLTKLLEESTGRKEGWTLIYNDDGHTAVQRWTQFPLWYKDYGKTWIAYAYPPVHIEREAWEPYIRQKCVSAGADVTISAEDVAAMMALFKMARVATGSYKADSWIDAAGYSASGGEIAGGKQ